MCGIAGIISTSKTNFNVNHFNILGTLNDERGGDSCGIFIDGNIKYGIAKNKLLRYFTTDIDYPKKASIALLHCRKASIEYSVNLDQCQPIIIKKNNVVNFVLMHNGTINNIQELKNKYIPKLNTVGFSDSQIMAQIIYNCGYDVLKEYQGTAVFVMVDYRKKNPEILVFKGSSCFNEKESDSERPLYYMIHENKFYFSSMYTSLYCIDYKSTILKFPNNKLCTITDNKVITITNIDRTKISKPNTILYSSVIDYYTYNNNSIDYTNSESYICNKVTYKPLLGIYYINNHPAHGSYTLYASGYTVPEHVKDYGTQYWFFEGRLLFSKDCYDFLTNIDDLFSDEILRNQHPEIIDYFAYSPRVIEDKLKVVDPNFNYVDYTDGTFVSLFEGTAINHVVNGVLTREYCYSLDTVDQFFKDKKNVHFNLEELENTVLNLITSNLLDHASSL